MKKHITNALKIWVVLTCAASQSRLMTYKELGKAVNVHHRGPSISEPLRLLMEYCQGKLPPLTALVVSKTTGIPKNWDGKKMGEWPRALRDIFQHKWTHEEVPTPKSLGAK